MFFEDYLDTAREEGREEERVNTERERLRAERAEKESGQLRELLRKAGIEPHVV